MSITMLKQNAEILLEVAENYQNLIQKKKNAPKQELEKYELQIKNFKNQFLYLLTAVHKLAEEQKNVK